MTQALASKSQRMTAATIATALLQSPAVKMSSTGLRMPSTMSLAALVSARAGVGAVPIATSATVTVTVIATSPLTMEPTKWRYCP